jgi:hypothetical protein
MGFVLFIILVCSWLVHKCCLCLSSSPLALSNRVRVVDFELLLFVFTFLIPCCYFWNNCGVRFVFYRCCLYDGWCIIFYICVCLRNMVSNTYLSLILSVSLEFTSLQFLMGSVLLVYLVCFLTYFPMLCCVCLYSMLRCSVRLYPRHPYPWLRVWRVMSFLYMLAYTGVWLYE